MGKGRALDEKRGGGRRRVLDGSGGGMSFDEEGNITLQRNLMSRV